MAQVTVRHFLLLCGATVFLASVLVLYWPEVITFTRSVYRNIVLHPPVSVPSGFPEGRLTSSSVRQSVPDDPHQESNLNEKNQGKFLSGTGNYNKSASSIGGPDKGAFNQRDPGRVILGSRSRPKDVSTTGIHHSSRLHGILPRQWNKFLIFECVPNHGLCGGWADRQEGMVTVFLLANLTNRRFGIRLTTPCDLQRFVVPNEYNWIISDEEIQDKTTKHVHSVDSGSFAKEVSTVDFNARYPEDVVFIQSNRDLHKEIIANPHYSHVLPPWARQTRPDFFRDVWQMMMKLSPHMQQRLDKFLRSVQYFNRSHPLVGVQVRTWGSAHFSDRHFGNTLSRLGMLWDFVQPYVTQGSELFVATDNPEVRNGSMARFGSHHHDAQAVLRHIDRQRSDPAICQAFEGAVMDQLILTHCDVLVISPNTGFGSRAAMIRGTNEQLFLLGSKSVSPLDIYKCTTIC